MKMILGEDGLYTFAEPQRPVVDYYASYDLYRLNVKFLLKV